jgi:hypothetical protein
MFLQIVKKQCLINYQFNFGTASNICLHFVASFPLIYKTILFYTPPVKKQCLINYQFINQSIPFYNLGLDYSDILDNNRTDIRRAQIPVIGDS